MYRHLFFFVTLQKREGKANVVAWPLHFNWQETLIILIT